MLLGLKSKKEDETVLGTHTTKKRCDDMCVKFKPYLYLSIYLSYPILSYPILSYPILSYPILSYPILSYPILSYPILSYLYMYIYVYVLLHICWFFYVHILVSASRHFLQTFEASKQPGFASESLDVSCTRRSGSRNKRVPLKKRSDFSVQKSDGFRWH